MVCPNCGKELKDESYICDRCGQFTPWNNMLYSMIIFDIINQNEPNKKLNSKIVKFCIINAIIVILLIIILTLIFVNMSNLWRMIFCYILVLVFS